MGKIDYEQLIRLVQSAEKIIMNRKTAGITIKGPADFVTQIDLDVQAYLKKELGLLYPDIQFRGEEQQAEKIDYDRPLWVLDPIDGTTNLIHGYGHSAVSLALYDGDELEFGIVFNPFRKETFYAVKGEGAYLNGERIRVSEVAKLEDSLIIFGTSAYEKEHSAADFDLYREVFLRSLDLRRLGAASLDLAYIACGRSDGYFEGNLKPWDFAAGVLLVQEAGGRVTNHSGENMPIDRNSSVLSTNGLIHEELMKILRPDGQSL